MKRAQTLIPLPVLASLVLVLSAAAVAQEQQINCKDAPAVVLAAFRDAYPKANIKGCSKETNKGQTAYEIESVEGKTSRDVTYSAGGKLISVEETLDTSDWPPGVKAALDRKFPSAEVLRAEKVTKGNVIGYEFWIKYKGKQTEIIFDADGNELKM
ncbi:MAG TPA: hypothetical protein VGX03_32080 [Candidatus Binatia bacterium]|nr:hypothetical protein [Candidatus Binatia bacterium]